MKENIIRRLDKDIADKISSEIPNINHLLDNHYKGHPAYALGALRHGKSVWIHTNKKDGELLLSDKLPTLISYIKETAYLIKESPVFARVYLYRLDAGQEIEEHSDTQPYYHQTKRYHIYFDIPEGLEIKYGGPTIESNTVIFFDPILPHYYKNNSNKDIWFCVFDLFN